jgi:hypothetical protein
MTLISRTKLAAVAAAVMTLNPVAASAQQACVTEDEVSAIAIYSMPSLVEAVRLRCQGELSPNGFLNRPNNSLKNRYATLQTRVWPRAKSGLLKIFAGRTSAAQSQQSVEMIRSLPDDAVRPLVDALIVQEASPKIDTKQCGRIERVIELASPIDPEIAGNVLGAVIGLVNPKELPVCPRRS